jgi:hypothetical protein
MPCCSVNQLHSNNDILSIALKQQFIFALIAVAQDLPALGHDKLRHCQESRTIKAIQHADVLACPASS